MAHVRLETSRITDRRAFHEECRRVLGFPAFYGRNMDAWNDCMSYLREDEGMVGVRLGPEELLHLEIADAESFNKRLPDVMKDIVECTSFVNRTRYIDRGEPPAIALVFT